MARLFGEYKFLFRLFFVVLCVGKVFLQIGALAKVVKSFVLGKEPIYFPRCTKIYIPVRLFIFSILIVIMKRYVY